MIFTRVIFGFVNTYIDIENKKIDEFIIHFYIQTIIILLITFLCYAYLFDLLNQPNIR